MNAPPVRYANAADGTHIAFTVSGAGPSLLRGPIGFNHVQALWSLAGQRRFFRALASRFRLITFDHRGQGMSTRGLAQPPTAAEYQLDIEAIVERLKPEPLVLFALTGLSHVALRYASLNPSRVRALVTYNAVLERQLTPTMEYGRNSRDHWDSFLFALGSALPLEDNLQVKKAFEQSLDFHDFLQQNEALQAFSLDDIAWPIEIPTLVLGSRTGSRAARFERDCQELSGLIPNSQMLMFDDSSGGTDAPDGQLPPVLLAIERFLAELPSGATNGERLLTARQLDVVRLIALGRSNPQIAEELVISLNTVQHHVSTILTKTGLTNRTELAFYAHRNGLN